ncbi:TetR/AcrR family transcriptional regulator [Mycobacterium hubeiense]|uniref:TetR/AcrR family transcriptional regulator n=1 Tax=Mycobacterium hubeiense TaxID=1867256 RepID=UPI000C7F5BD4|nr:TetR/AcrR family transcriptional regulator [Mycobacterium sp. QGD 101]
MTTVSHAPRGRRSARPSGDDRELAILTTAERLLEERPFAEISVDDLAKGAGLSRPTFYFYFPSKDAVLLTLFERVMIEADSTLDGQAAEEFSTDPARSWRDGIYAFMELFRGHRAVALAGLSGRATNPELRELWSTFMQKWVNHVATVIEFERARGVAPVTIPAKDLSAALNLMNERAMIASFSGEQPAMSETTVLDTLVHVWVTSIYGQTP